MLVRTPRKTKLTAEQQEQLRARRRRATRECRARKRKNLAIAQIVYDDRLLNLLVRENYLTDAQADDEDLISAAISKYLWNVSRRL